MIRSGGVYTTFCQKEGILLKKYRDRNGRSISILFRSIRVRGRFYSSDSKRTFASVTARSLTCAKDGGSERRVLHDGPRESSPHTYDSPDN